MFDQQPAASPGSGMPSGLDADLAWLADHVCGGCPGCDPETFIDADEVYDGHGDEAIGGADTGDGEDGAGDAVAEALFFPEEPVVADPRSVAQADAEVAAVLADGPSGQTAVELSRLTPSMLSVAGRMDLIAAWQAQEAWTASQTAACLAEHLGAEPDGPVMDAHTVEVDHEVLGWRMLLGETATVLRMAEGTLHRRYRIAWALATRLPATRAALRAGKIGWLHALAVSEATELLTDDQAAQVDTTVMRNADRLSGATLRRRLRRAVIAADPDAAVAKARKAHTDRGIRVWSDPDGAGHLEAWSDHRDTWCLKQAVDLLAGPREADDPRSLDARRFDALLGAVLGAVDGSAGQPDHPAAASHEAAGDGATTRHGRRLGGGIALQVVVDLATLAGLADHTGHVPGYGPVPAGLVRDWLTDATSWRRLVTDPVTGHLLDYGPSVRFPPPRLEQFLKARDRSCIFPDCNQPATRCDADHHPPWKPDGTGGSTSARDMAMLCRHHHHWLTHGGWQLDHLPDGRHRFTSPTGRIYESRQPPTLPTDDR